MKIWYEWRSGVGVLTWHGWSWCGLSGDLSGVGPMPCEGFLVGSIFMYVLVGGARSCLSEGQWLGPVVWFGGVYGFSMTLGSLFTDVQVCAPIWLKDR